MTLKKHERLAYRLSDILIKLNAGERLDILALAETYQVSIRTLKRDFQDRLTPLDFSECGPRFYQLHPKKIGYLDITDIKRFANFVSVQDLLPKIDRIFFKNNSVKVSLLIVALSIIVCSRIDCSIKMGFGMWLDNVMGRRGHFALLK